MARLLFAFLLISAVAAIVHSQETLNRDNELVRERRFVNPFARTQRITGNTRTTGRINTQTYGIGPLRATFQQANIRSRGSFTARQPVRSNRGGLFGGRGWGGFF